MVRNGVRVIRGPDWDRHEIDGGEGHLGTVVRITAEDGTAEVVWDNGQIITCRVGKEGKHDLRIYDNATVGVMHPSFACDSCRRKPIRGARWRCTLCPDYNLCTPCYGMNVHDVKHTFERFTTDKEQGVMVGTRHGQSRVRLKGIFPGATVTRGPDWSEGDKDGGAGSRGVVVDVVSPERASARNAVRVGWDNGQSLQHRLGLQGKVDLVCTEEAPGPACYVSHLPLIAFQVTRAAPASTHAPAPAATVSKLAAPDTTASGTAAADVIANDASQVHSTAADETDFITNDATSVESASAGATAAATTRTEASAAESTGTGATPKPTEATPAPRDSTLTPTDATSASTEATPASTEATPASTKATPASTEATQASTKTTPASAEATPASNKATPASAEATLASTNSSAASTKATPASAEATPASTDSSAASTKATPASAEAIPASAEATPASSKATPASTEATPASTNSSAASTDATPAPPEKTPAPTEKTPAPPGETPAPTEDASAPAADAAASSGGEIQVGDKVRVGVDEETFRAIQVQASMWTKEMAKLMGRTGVVKTVDANGLMDVDFGGVICSINTIALTKGAVEDIEIAVGDNVRIVSDEEKVRELQEAGAGWNESMIKYLGKVGQVEAVTEEGFYRVVFGKDKSENWNFDPKCCVGAPGCGVDRAVPDAPRDPYEERDRMLLEGLQHIMQERMGKQGRRPPPSQERVPPAGFNYQGPPPSLTNLCSSIRAGQTDRVMEMLEENPQLARETASEGTPLHLAAFNGQVEMVETLVDKGADINKGDRQGNTPLMRAVQAKRLGAAEALLEMGANINVSNGDGQTPLHRAFSDKMADMCRLLLRYVPDVNKTDSNGDTPLFIAVEEQHTDPGVLDTLLAAEGLDLQAVNRKGFNVIHVAALKDRQRALEQLLINSPSLVNAKERDDGYLPIHIAAVNDYTGIMDILIRFKSEISPKSRKGQTPLHLAAGRLAIDSLMMLVENGADLSAQDQDGDTALHDALNPGASMMGVLGGGHSDRLEARLQVANYLIQMGAPTNIRNHNNKTPLDMTSGELRARIQSFMQDSIPNGSMVAPDQSQQPQPVAMGNGPSTGPGGEEKGNGKCLNCTTRDADVIFLPCAHKLSCRECGPKLQTCPECGQSILGRVDTDGTPLESSAPKTKSEAPPQAATQGDEGVTDENCKVQ